MAGVSHQLGGGEIDGLASRMGARKPHQRRCAGLQRGVEADRGRELAHFLDHEALALLVVELELLDRHGLRCCAVDGIDVPEASQTFSDN